MHRCRVKLVAFWQHKRHFREKALPFLLTLGNVQVRSKARSIGTLFISLLSLLGYRGHGGHGGQFDFSLLLAFVFINLGAGLDSLRGRLTRRGCIV